MAKKNGTWWLLCDGKRVLVLWTKARALRRQRWYRQEMPNHTWTIEPGTY